jgi:hypothetical protein
MLTFIEGLGLRQIADRTLHKLALGVRAAEAVGLALDRRIDGAIRLHVLVIGETPGTHVPELAGHRIGRTGKADDEDAGCEVLFHFGRSFRFGRPPVTYLNIGIRETLFTRPFRAICRAAPRRARRSPRNLARLDIGKSARTQSAHRGGQLRGDPQVSMSRSLRFRSAIGTKQTCSMR